MSKVDEIVACGDARPLAGGPRIAVLIPCFNEEVAIAKVVGDFRAVLPQAAIYVYDNNSTDRTVDAARGAGAVVRRETCRYMARPTRLRRGVNGASYNCSVH